MDSSFIFFSSVLAFKNHPKNMLSTNKHIFYGIIFYCTVLGTPTTAIGRYKKWVYLHRFWIISVLFKALIAEHTFSSPPDWDKRVIFKQNERVKHFFSIIFECCILFLSKSSRTGCFWYAPGKGWNSPSCKWKLELSDIAYFYLELNIYCVMLEAHSPERTQNSPKIRRSQINETKSVFKNNLLMAKKGT